MKIVNPNIEHHPSVEKISASYEHLKEGVGELAGQVKSEATEAASRVGSHTYDFLKEKMSDARSGVSSDLGKIKSYIRQEPAKGVAIAFVAGALVSALMRH